MNLTMIGAAVLLVGYVLVRRLVGEPLVARRLVVLPALVVVWGATSLAGALSPLDVAALLVEAGIAALSGVARGATVRLFTRDGHLWYRYRPLTVAVWLGLLVARAGVAATAHAAGAHAAVLGTAVLLMFGLSLLAEAAVIGWRALGTGVPFAPRRRRRAAGRMA